MKNVFLYGTLCHLPLLEIVAGKAAADLAPEEADILGHYVVWAAGEGFPLICEGPGRRAKGVLLRDVDDETLERLNFYELGFGYDLKDVTVQAVGQAVGQAAGETVAAMVYVPRPGLWQAGEPWQLADWVRDWWPLTRHSAAEVMSYYGRLSGAEVASRYGMIKTRAAARLAAETEPAPCTLRACTGFEDVALAREDVSHAGFFLAKTLHLRHPLFAGGMSDEVVREVFIAGDASIVLPYDPVRDRVMLVEQFRLGPYARGDARPWALEPVAGRIDGGETPEASAHREAHEEAGITLHRLEKIASYYPTPGYSSEYFHTYLGIADLPDSAAGIGGLDTEHEDIRAHILSFGAALALVESGEINIGPAILSLIWLQRERPRLRDM